MISESSASEPSMAIGERRLDSENLDYIEALYEQYLVDPASVDAQWRQVFDQWPGAGDNGSSGRGKLAFVKRSIFDPAPSHNGNGHPVPAGPPAPAATASASAEPPAADTAASSNGHPPNSPSGPAPANGDGGSAIDESGVEDAQLDERRQSNGRRTQDASALQHQVDQLIRNYRVRGHQVATLDPLSSRGEELPQELRPEYYNFTEEDMDQPFVVTPTVPGDNTRTLRQIIAQMHNTYCGFIGAQFMHIDDLRMRRWLQQRMEQTENTVQLTRKDQIRILTRLTDAVIFEQFIQKKFIGAKSFSLEGAESLIPLLDMAFERSGEQGIREIVIAMAHRGRLNVLANVIGKSPHQIFREFEDVDPKLYLGGGDVKYHLGYSGDWRTRSGKNIHLSLSFNPSHLEHVNPVASGRMRAKQDRSPWDSRGEKGMVLAIHGDASFAGEGIVQETLNLSQLKDYNTGGTLHVILNNQLGFTTSPREGRSGQYCTDVAKMLQVPIFHVNGEAPEAVAQTIRLALDFRYHFRRDVVIDMYCYRRRGHNEGDEPSFTQPRMYGKIDERQSVREAYLSHLLKLGGVSKEDAERIATRRTELLEKELTTARSESYLYSKETPSQHWSGYFGGPERETEDPSTTYDKSRLAGLLVSQTKLPEDFHIHPKLTKLLRLKQEMAKESRAVDWATAESLAFATLAVEGTPIRLSGQDSQRGTFSQRHTLLHDVNDGHEYMPLAHLSQDQARVEFINSPLSEQGVVGFDYGYSLDRPDGLVLWEAQFGDFVNGAQVIIDQFITTAEDKWQRLSGLVMLLPHGFEGQGPEHSSARLERFLTQAAEDNIQVTQPTTPAQYFHLLRRQVIRPWRKPLIVMTPKSLLRHAKCVSPLDQLAQGKFHRVLPDETDDIEGEARQGVSRVLLCSGKVYYDLLEKRRELGRHDVAIIRLEQFYPFPEKRLRELLAAYEDETPAYWVQEEPANMGGWPFLRGMFCHRLFDRMPLDAITRPASASPATGSKAAHQLEQQKILAQAFGNA